MLKAVSGGASGSGSGTVTSVSVATANGVSGSVADPTTTPIITLTLGAITPTTVAIGAGSAITSSGPGGALTVLGFTAPGTGVATALGNTAGGAGGFALVGTTPPTGTAGGELAGTYPNPTLLNSAVIGKVLTGYTSGAGTVAATDSILQAIQKLNGNAVAGPVGTAGGSLKGTYPNPGLGDVNTIATSLAIGGATIGTDALGVTGTATISGRASLGGVTNTGNGAASVSNGLWNGTVFTGGSGTTNFPAMFVQPAGTAAVTTWSTTGTGLGMNLASGFAGNFLDFHVAGGASLFSINQLGSITASGGVSISGTFTAGASQQYAWLGRGILTSPVAGSIQLGAADASVAIAETLRVQSVVAGTAAANGANWTLIGSLPTGTGTSGDIIFQTGVKTGSGTTQGTATTALTIKGETQAITIASGKSLVLGNSATTGLAAGVLAATTNATLVITDASGQAYRIPCII